MNFVKIYYDLTREIEVYEMRLQDLESELRAARKLIHTGTLPSDPQPVHVPLDKALADYDAVVAKIREVSEWLAEKKERRRQIEASIRGFEGIEYQVAYLRDIERMPLQAIAKRLGYEYGYIRNVSSRIRKVTKK